MGTAMTDPNGVFDSGTGPEKVARRVIPDTPVDIVFHVFCGTPTPNETLSGSAEGGWLPTVTVQIDANKGWDRLSLAAIR
jgi:hypothetical protein